MRIVEAERRSALRAALLVIVPIFMLPVLFVVLPELGVELPPIAPWLILGPVSLSALVLVAVMYDRRVARRERIRSATHSDPAPRRHRTQ